MRTIEKILVDISNNHLYVMNFNMIMKLFKIKIEKNQKKFPYKI